MKRKFKKVKSKKYKVGNLSGYTHGFSDEEICKIMGKILNVPKKRIADNIDLFYEMKPYIINALYYLSQMKTPETMLDAVYVLEYLLSLNQNPFH